MTRGDHLALSDEWGTSPQLVELAREVLGGIDYDPFSHPYWDRWTIKAARFDTIETDGLRPDADWNGRKLVNAPGTLYRPAWRRLARSCSHTFCLPAIWIGFNLEQLQDLQLNKPTQRKTSWSRVIEHPLVWPTVVIAGRVPYVRQPWGCQDCIKYMVPKELRDADGNVLHVICSRCSSPNVAPDPDHPPIPGPQPTHGTYVTLLSHDPPTIRRFRRLYGPMGQLVAPFPD